MIAALVLAALQVQDGRADAEDAAPAGVERLHIERPDDTVVIIADKASQAGVVAQVMDEVTKAGIKEVSIAAAPEATG